MYFTWAKMDVCVCQGRGYMHVLRVWMHVCRNVSVRCRMTGGEPGCDGDTGALESVQPSSRTFPFMLGPWITLYNALCQVLRRKIDDRDQLPFKMCYYYPWRGGSPPATVSNLIPSKKEGEFGSFISEMFIYATHVPWDMEKPLLQVITAEPQHITHFLSFNLPFSMWKLLWSPHPAVKHAHYSIMRAVLEAVFKL